VPFSRLLRLCSLLAFAADVDQGRVLSVTLPLHAFPPFRCLLLRCVNAANRLPFALPRVG
jgi:hypothetical protein